MLDVPLVCSILVRWATTAPRSNIVRGAIVCAY